MALSLKFNLDSFKTQVMTMGGAIGVGALASSVGAHPLLLAGHGLEAGAALGAFAGILAAYGQAAHFDAIKNKLGDPDEVLNNGDLVRLVGETIRQRILAEKATPANAPHGKILDALANAAPVFWKATATADAVPDDYADLTEGRLVSFFSRIDGLTADQTALDAGRWRNFLVELANDAGITGLSGVEYALAEALHRHFPHDLRELLKHAFATGDKAYAAMQFRLFDSLRGGVGDLSKKLDIVVAVLQGQTGTLDALTTGQAELKELIQKLQEQLSVKDRQIDGLIGALSTPGTNPQAAPTVTPQAQAIADLLPDTGDAFDRALKAIAEKRFDDARQLLNSVIPEEEVALAELEREREAATERLVQRYVARGETEYYDLKYSTAAEWYQKASNLRPDDAIFLNRIGFLYFHAGDYIVATNFFKRALSIYEQTLGTMHPDTLTILSNLAQLYCTQGFYDQSELLYKQGLAICEQVLGALHPDTAGSLNGLGALYYRQGLYEKAKPLYLRALTIRKQLLGEMHPETATSINNLAVLYEAEGLYDKSELLCKQALIIREQLHGVFHPATATSINNLGVLRNLQDRCREAETLLQQAYEIRVAILGASHPDAQESAESLHYVRKQIIIMEDTDKSRL